MLNQQASTCAFFCLRRKGCARGGVASCMKGCIGRYLDKSRNYRKKLFPKNCAVIFDCRRGLICGDRLFVLVLSSVVLAIFYKGSPWLLLAFAIRCIR